MDQPATLAPLGPTTLTLFAALAIAVAALTRTRPLVVLAIIAATIPFNFAHTIGPTTIDAAKISLLAALAALTILGPRDLVPATRIARWILVLLATTVAIDLAGSPAAHFRAATLRESFKAAEYALTFLVAAALARRSQRQRPDDFAGPEILITAILVFGVSATALIHPAQGESVFRLGNALVPRAAGVLEGPNQLAGYLGLLLAALLAASFVPPRRLDLAPGLALVVGAVTLIATFSRSGIVAAFVSVTVIAWRTWPLLVRRRPAATRSAVATTLSAALAAALVAIAAIGLVARSEDVAGERLDGLATRSELWHAAVVLWERAPLLGIGAGNFEFSLPSVGLLDVRTHANNYYLQTLAENGVVGLLVALALLGCVIGGLARRPPEDRVAAGALAATIGLACHQLVDDLVFFPKVGETWWLLIGFAFALGEGSRGSSIEGRACENSPETT